MERIKLKREWTEEIEERSLSQLIADDTTRGLEGYRKKEALLKEMDRVVEWVGLLMEHAVDAKIIPLRLILAKLKGDVLENVLAVDSPLTQQMREEDLGEL